jgi:glycosyltransferase involved in cell wall biosynthesis
MGLNKVMANVTAVVVDNDGSLLERSLHSLKAQTVPVKIILAPGPKTDLDVARKLADMVLEPTVGIGKARVKGILTAETDYILSCDSDSVYESHYAEYAVEDLKKIKAVKAGTILPLEWKEPLTLLETALTLIPPYEFSLCFRRQAFLDAKIHLEDYSNPRADIGGAVVNRLNALPDFRLVCWSRIPTKSGYEFAEKYLPSAVAGFTPVLAVAGVVGISEFGKR